jgi:hypothetical protein
MANLPAEFKEQLRFARKNWPLFDLLESMILATWMANPHLTLGELYDQAYTDYHKNKYPLVGVSASNESAVLKQPENGGAIAKGSKLTVPLNYVSSPIAATAPINWAAKTLYQDSVPQSSTYEYLQKQAEIYTAGKTNDLTTTTPEPWTKVAFKGKQVPAFANTVSLKEMAAKFAKGAGASPVASTLAGTLGPPPQMWCMHDALGVLRRIQPLAKVYGYHVCLGGGVVNTGGSDKDLDLYFLPMGGKLEPLPEDLIRRLSERWGVPEIIGKIGEYPDRELPYTAKLKFLWEQDSGLGKPRVKRIDVFVLGAETIPLEKIVAGLTSSTVRFEPTVVHRART